MRWGDKYIPTADEVARAIIAAARVYGVDPIEVCSYRTAKVRGAAAAAVSALGRCDCRVSYLTRRLKMSDSAVPDARRRGAALFRAAERAAMQALRPERLAA